MKETVPKAQGCSPGSRTLLVLHNRGKTTIPIVLPHTGTPVTSDITWLRLVVKQEDQKCKLGVSFTSVAGPLAV